MAVTADTYAPFDSGPGANAMEDTWRKFMRHVNGGASGVLRGVTSECLAFGDNSGMQVKVSAGECWIRGHWAEFTSTKTLAIAAAHATLARIDRVILRLDTVNNRVETDVLTGTAAGSPAVPSLTQSSSVWETSLATVSVPATDTSIASNQVTDDRTYLTCQIRVRQVAAQSISNNSWTKLLYDTVSTGSDAGSSDVVYNTTDRTFDIGRPGIWSIVANSQNAVNTTGDRRLAICKNGEETTDRLSQHAGTAAALLSLHCTAQNRFAVGDKVGIYVLQTSGGALNTLTTERGVNVSLMWEGP